MMLNQMVSILEGCEVAQQTRSAEQALQFLESGGEADIAIVDLSLPGMAGIALVETLREQYPALKTLIYSGHKDAAMVTRALEAGASGYIVKGRPRELTDGLAAVRSGEQYLSPGIAELEF